MAGTRIRKPRALNQLNTDSNIPNPFLMKDIQSEFSRKDSNRQRIITEAIQAADKILMAQADGSVEELNYLTAQVAKIFVEKALSHFSSGILKKDLGL